MLFLVLLDKDKADLFLFRQGCFRYCRVIKALTNRTGSGN
jgi:hypothetical protein